METIPKDQHFGLVTAILTICFIGYLVSTYFTNGLNRYPGPKLARFSNLWHYYDVKSNKHHEHLIALHRRYGSIVRIGPNRLSIADPNYVDRIYSTQAAYPKSEMYDSFCLLSNGQKTSVLLSERDLKVHARNKKAVAHAFTATAVRGYEGSMDEVIRIFMARLRERIEETPEFLCDFGLWIRFYVTETILYLTFGSVFGFLDAGEEHVDFFNDINTNMDKDSLYIPMPWWLHVTKFNPILALLPKESSFVPRWCMSQIKKREQERSANQTKTPHLKHTDSDFLDKFIDAAQTPSGIDYDRLREWCIINVQAGSDTITVELISVLYHLLKNPEKLTALMEELQAVKLSDPVTLQEARQLEYLDACIKEGMRIHPAVGLGLERMVTGNGLRLPDGSMIPEGVRVSINPWVITRQPLYGDEPDNFIPERWLRAVGESEVDYTSRLHAWQRADMVFSHGHHSCPGKSFAIAEMYKILPTLLLNFKIDLQDQKQSWKTINRFIVRQADFNCVIRKRS